MHNSGTIQPSNGHRFDADIALTIKLSGCFTLDLPPEFAHPANRPRQPRFYGSKIIFLAPEAADEIARLHANDWLRTEAADDRWNI